MIDVTIAIITYNRPLWLSRLLKSLTFQEFDEGVSVEVLVVDNACEERIQILVRSIGKQSPCRMHYIEEKTSGIVAARNKAVEYFLNSDSRNLLFIDDDEWPNENNWAQTMLNGKKLHSADIVTSRVISVGGVDTPNWAVDLIYGNNPYEEGNIVTAFYTNNLLISRHVLDIIKPAFDSRFAMTGASDYHFALKCKRIGLKAVYVEAPVMEEFPKSRANIKWFIRRGFRSGIGYTRSHLYEEKLSIALLKCVSLSLIRFLRGSVSLFIGGISNNRLKKVDGIFRLSSSLGTIMGFFGVKYNEYKEIHGR